MRFIYIPLYRFYPKANLSVHTRVESLQKSLKATVIPSPASLFLTQEANKAKKKKKTEKDDAKLHVPAVIKC